MASGEQTNPIKGQKHSASCGNSRNDCDDTQWMLLPNNLELSTRAKPSKKQRNKEKHRSFINAENMASSSKSGDSFSCNPVTFQNFPRMKCNTATWLKDQFVNDERSKRGPFELEEVFSDSDLALSNRGNMNFPVPHTFHGPEHSQEFQRPPSRRSIVENENTKSVKDDFKKNEADTAINFETLSQLQDFISEATSFCQELEITDDPASEIGAYAANGISPSSSASKTSNSKGNIVHRHSNGNAAFCSEDDRTKCNHLLEKMKQSDERLMALKFQKTLLYHMKKKKLASIQAASNLGAHGGTGLESDNATFEHANSCSEEQVINSSQHWNPEVAEQRHWVSVKPLPSAASDQIEQACSWKDEPQDIKQLHISLEHIRKRVQSMQQISDSKNMAGSLSSDDCDIADVGERVAAVEWERKMLKNKLVELQEKKKMNDELLRELSYLKDAAVGAGKNDDESNFLPVGSRTPQVPPPKDKKKKAQASIVDTGKKLHKLEAYLRHLEGMMKAMSPDESIVQDASLNVESTDMAVPRLGPRNARSVISMKRDNVRKEQNSGFPARRHYEAEGRANEDADVPAVPAPTLSPVLDKWKDHPEIQAKIRKFQVAQQHVKVINDLMASIQEAKKSGAPLPIEQLRLQSAVEKEGKKESDEEESGSDSEDDRNCQGMIPQGSSESVATSVKEVCAEAQKSASLEIENHKRDDAEHPMPEDLNDVIAQKDQLAKLQSEFHQLMLMFPSFERRNDDPVRSSGEGGYTQNRNTSGNTSVTTEHVRTLPPVRTVRQDNLQLTRQNIASMESQNQNSSSNLHNRDCNSVKKDNINNLSGKMGKLSIQNPMNGSFSEGLNAPKDNLDAVSTFSSEMNQSHCHSNEIEHKTILDILKRDHKKQKLYDRNHDNQICSNSSIDSEPFEGSNSALAADTTVAATWGGSSTQDNFDDENDEPVESLEEQDDDDEGLGVPVLEKKTLGGQRTTTQFSDQFSNMQQYIESVTNIPEKRQENLHHKGFNRNSTTMRIGCHNHAPKVMRSNRKSTTTSNIAATTGSGQSRDIPDSSNSCGDISEDYEQNLAKFWQQLKTHIDKLNALCQRHFNDKPQTPMNFHQASNCSQTMPNTCPSLQAVPEIPQPCNQQLLLNLSQCYHALYMQQLEIQHLHRCIRHHMDADLIHQASNMNPPGNNSEDIGFRPWCMSTWSNPLIPSNLYPADQVSPMSSAAYLQLPLKPYSTHSNPSYAPVSGTRPVRAVIHPASQESTTSQETLNNQVPPRTRANNFWDNFRSYSRQNLLSTSNNTKRNENVGLPVAPQIRQVHPLIPNEGSNRAPDVSNSYSSASSPAELNRPLPNPELQDLITRSKKANSNSPCSSMANCSSTDFQKKTVPSNINSSGVRSTSVRSLRSNRCHVQNTEPSSVPPVSYPSSVNLIQLYPVQDDSKVGNFSSICPTSVSESAASHAASEISSSSQNENNSDFLIGLFREAQGLRSDLQQQKALKIIRDLALNERSDDGLSQSKILNDHPVATCKTESSVNAVSVQTTNSSSNETCNQVMESSDAEKHISRVSAENSIPWSSQNLPTAAIPPLSKHSTPKPVSTGAVRKKPKLLSTCFWDTLSNATHACSYESLEGDPSWESLDTPPLIQQNSRAPSDFPGNIVENIILDLQSTLPFGQLREDSSPAFWAAISTCIIESLRMRINFPLSRKTLSSFRQTLDHFLTRFSGTKFCDCESDFLKCVAEFLYESLTCFVSTGRFASSSLFPSVPDEESSSLETDDKIHELCVKMPIENDEKTRELCIKMPTEENDVFIPQFRTVLQQNVLPGAMSCEVNASGEANIPPDGATAVMDDVGQECGPEAETEPEVEAGTEADLAEADQSPGQQGTVGASSSLPSAETWCEQAAILLSRSVGASNASVLLNCEDVAGAFDETTEISAGAQFCPDACIDQEAILDDIPTKLCPASEEQLQKQLKEDQSMHLSLSDDVNDTNEFVAESNCDTELTSLK